MRASSRSSRSAGLHIGGKPTEGFRSEQVGGGSGGLLVAAVRAPLVGHPPLPDKGKERINEIRYPTRSEYLKAAVRCSDAVGPSRVEPSYAEIFVSRYRPPIGIHVWRPDFLTSYVFHVPKMVWFLRWPLKMVSASLYTLSSSASFSTSMYAQPSFPLTSGAFWLASLLFSGIKAWGFPAQLYY